MNGISPYKPITPRIESHQTNASGLTRRQAAKNSARRILKSVLLSMLVVIVVLIGLVAIRTFQISGKIFVGENASFSKQLASFFNFGSTKLAGEDDGQINVLLLGIGGQNHDGGYLADTIILAQIRPDLGKIALSAIPRDYLSDLPGLGQRKINAAFAEEWQSTHNWDEAGRSMRKAVSDVTGLDIPYFAVVDFKGFELGVDKLGGVDVTVERTFTDYTFPDENEGYLPPVTFGAGQEHMSGSRALIYARSRHAAGGEGSDFARSQRQQIILDAVKQKAVALNLVSNAGTINSLLSIFGDHFHTNVSPAELFHLYSLTKNYPRENILANNLSPETKLICPQILESNGAYVLAPCASKTKDDVKQFFADAFETTARANQSGIVWLADSTGTLYAKAEKLLNDAGFTVYRVSYKSQALDQTVIFQANSGAKGLDYLTSTLGGKKATVAPPGVNADPAKVDFVIILGGSLPNVKSAIR